jgi:hypothetical protein
MRRTGNTGLVAAALLTVASALPEQAAAQVPDAFDVRNSSFAPAGPAFDTRSVLMTASTGWVAHRGMPAQFAGCPRPSPYMFGSNPGMFHYGWYMSPFDARFSRTWFFPYARTWFDPSFAWYAGWGGRPGFAYGSYWRGAGPGAWGPWPGASGMCGPGSAGSAFFFGAGGFGYGGYPGFGGFGYGGYPGYGGFGGFGNSYGGYSGYRGFTGLSGDSSAYPGGSGFDSSEWGHIPESLRNMKGFRVIESRPATVGADLRRSDPSRLDRWFDEFGPEGERVRASAPTTRDPIADARARGQATERASRESISDKIARARSAERAGSTGPRSAPDRTKAAPSRAAAPSSKPARATPRSSSRPSAGSAARSAPSSTRARATPRSSPRPAPKTPKKSSRSSGKTPQ